MKRWMASFAPAARAALVLALSATFTACSDDSNDRGTQATPEFLGELGTRKWGAIRDLRDIAVDEQGRVSVLDGASSLQRFEADGTPLGPLELRSGYRIAILGGEIFVTSGYVSNGIAAYSPDGQLLRQFGPGGEAAGHLRNPVDLVAAADGTILVLDSARDRIVNYSTAGEFLGEWGEYGEDPGEFSYPAALAAGPDGSVVVYDRDRQQLQRYSIGGTPLGEWPLPAAISSQILARSDLSLAFASGGELILAAPRNSDAGGALLCALDQAGGLIRSMELPRSLVGSSGVVIAAGPDGQLVLAGENTDRVVALRADWQPGQSYGHPFGDLSGEFSNPVSIALTPAGDIWVSDSGVDDVIRFDSSGAMLERIHCIPSSSTFSCESTGPLASSGDGGVFVAVGVYLGVEIVRLGQGGVEISRWSIPLAARPLQMAEGVGGRLFLLVDDYELRPGNSHRVWQIGPDGTLEAATPSPDPSDPEAPEYTAIGVDRSGRLWAWDRNMLQFMIYRPGLILEETLPGARDGAAPVRDVSAFAIADNGDIFVDDSDRTRIIRLSFGGFYLGSMPFPQEYAGGSFYDTSPDIEAGPGGRVYAIKSDHVLVFGPPESAPVAVTRPGEVAGAEAVRWPR